MQLKPIVQGDLRMNRAFEKQEAEKTSSGSKPSGGGKPYKRPQLTKMGSLRDITMHLAGGGAKDGGSGTKNGTKRGGNFDGAASSADERAL
jgi:hypothetical protein